MPRSFTPPTIAIIIILSIIVPIPVIAAGEYQIEASDSVNAGSRTVTVDGSQYLIDSVGQVAVDNSLSISVEAPDDESVQVYLYNNKRDIVEIRDQTGSGSVTINMAGYDPGSYVLALLNDDNGTIEDIQPLVVSGWAASLSLPAEVEQGQALSATVSINELTEMPEPESVEVVLVQQDSVISRVDAEKIADGKFKASLNSDREPGTYRVYANVRNTTTVDDHHEVVGMTHSQTIEIKTPSTTENLPEQTTTGSTGGGSQPPGQTTEDNLTTTTATKTTTQSMSTSSTSKGVTDTTTFATTSSEHSDLITVSSPTSTTTETTTPGLGILTGLAALVCAVLLTRVYR